MKIVIFSSLILSSLCSLAQEKTPQKMVQVLGGYSKTGSGDMPGFVYGAEYAENFKRKLSWSVGFSGFIYSKETALLSTDNPYYQPDGGLRHTTAGVQVTGHLGLRIVRTPVHELVFRLGPLVKYQSASTDGYSITNPIAFGYVTGYAGPIISLINYYPQNTIAAGGSVQILYRYTIRNKISIGILAGGQTDTEGDTMSQLALTVGRKF